MPEVGYRTFPYKGFGGGLNLRDGPDVVAEDQAIDALNVMFTTRGAVAQRSGYAKFTGTEGTNRYDSLAAFYKADGTKHLLAAGSTKVEALSAAGSVLASNTGTGTGPHFFQRFGGPTAEHIYIANGVDSVKRWTGTTFETPTYAGMTPTGKFLGLSSTDNRLVCARYPSNVAGNNAASVHFSAEGDPTTFDADDYVDLTPGDGEEIMGVASWRDLIFVFKQSKFFVFYGNSVDDEGDPVFNYRPVDASVGLVSPRALAVSEQGVYFLDRTGIYFTSGGQPARVSDLVEPIFHGGASVYYQGGELNDGSITETTMVYHDERLWLSFPGGASAVNNRNLVFDPHEKWWSLADIPAGPMVNFRPSHVEELVFGYASGLKHLGRYVDGVYTADDMSQAGAGGSAISSRWQGGWFNYATPLVKTIREAKINGTGLVTVKLHRDYRQLPSVTASIELSPPVGLYDSGLEYDTPGLIYGPAQAIQAKMIRKAIRGEVFSIGLSNSTISRSFKVHRLTTHIREARVPSVVKVR